MLFNPHKVLHIHKFLQHSPLNALLDRPYQRAVAKAVNIADLRLIAARRCHKMIFDYLDGGADDEITLRRNKDAYTQYEMHYKILAGIQPPLDLSTELFGSKVDVPFFGCPTAGNKMFHVEGEAAAAQAAAHHGALYTMSSLSTTDMATIESITAGQVPKLFQLYVWKDRALVRDVLQQAKEANFQALALTVDVAWMGNRERDLRNRFSVPPNYSLKQTLGALQRPAWTYDFLSHEPYTYACINKDIPAESMVSFINSQLTPDFDWKDAEWLLGEWHTPHTALKGVVRPEDALKAKKIGFETIWVSNHGGRQLETAPATIDVLPLIRAAVGPDMPIIIDGGVQRGTDICKAIAMGANGIGVGKPYLWGLAAGGKAGVIKAYDILKAELDRAMGLLGVANIAELQKQGPALIRRRQPSVRDFPDIHAEERGYGGGII